MLNNFYVQAAHDALRIQSRVFIKVLIQAKGHRIILFFHVHFLYLFRAIIFLSIYK